MEHINLQEIVKNNKNLSIDEIMKIQKQMEKIEGFNIKKGYDIGNAPINSDWNQPQLVFAPIFFRNF